MNIYIRVSKLLCLCMSVVGKKCKQISTELKHCFVEFSIRTRLVKNGRNCFFV